MKKRRLLKRSLFFAFFLTIVIAVFSYFTNPFVKFSVVKDPFSQVLIDQSLISLESSSDLYLKQNIFVNTLVQLKSGWHIIGGRFGGGPKASGHTVDEIIKEIHADRFDPKEPFIISGDHFSLLYPRSLGIFYHSLLDDRTALSAEDWQNRQIIYLKTLAYASGVYAQSDRLSTTIVPISPRSVALMNIYAPPSDTLYSLLFAFEQLLDNSYQRTTYPYENKVSFPSATKLAAQKLLAEHHESYKRHYQTYKDQVYDPGTGLIKENLLLSGTKDIQKRSGAFYDNVIFWRTTQLAGKLGLIPVDTAFLNDYKKRIIERYWDDTEGLFIEDLSPESLAEKWYSSDWLITTMTGFLDPGSPADRYYLTKAVAYIERNAIDKPFALQFHPDKRNKKLYRVVRWMSPNYGSTAIWSNWGMEYTKLLTRLAITEKNFSYLEQAKSNLDAYTFNIKRYQGYPEVYDQDGDFYRTLFYKSVRQTGWVVTYEQAREMYEDAATRFVKPQIND